MDEAVRRYIEGIDPAFRPLFDQIHGLVMAAHPEATVVLSYQIPTDNWTRRLASPYLAVIRRWARWTQRGAGRPRGSNRVPRPRPT
jgi:hypothetical protein